MNYYTKSGVDITERIKHGKTKLIEGISVMSKAIAEIEAKKMNSYVFEVFSDNRDRKRILVGYAVPK